MEARDGNKFATVYYQQSLEQRKALTKHIRSCTREFLDYLEKNPKDMEWFQTTPLTGFPKTKGQKNRTGYELLTDIIGEATGRKKNGLPKDYAMAPIDRWNKLFKDSDYEFKMEENPGTTKTTFDQLWSIE